MVLRNRERKAPIFVFLIPEGIVHDLAIESPVRKIGQSDERVVRDVCRGWISPGPLVTESEDGSIGKEVVSEEVPFLPTGTVLVDVPGVDADLGLEKRGGCYAVRERGEIFARAVVVHSLSSKRGGGFGRHQSREHGEQETEMKESQHSVWQR